MKVDLNARYLESHEYAKADDGLYQIGISDSAQASLGDIVFVELPELGLELSKGSVFGVLESAKAASDLYLPVGGIVEAINTTLKSDPGLINRDCYGAGWIIKIRATTDADFASLQDASTYEANIT